MLEISRGDQITDNSFSRAADKKNQYYNLLYSEMAERRRIEEHLRRSNLLLQAVSQAQLQYVAGTELALVFRTLLRTLLSALRAEQGLLREYVQADEPAKTQPLFIQEGRTQGGDPKELVSIASRVLETRRLFFHSAEDHWSIISNLPPDSNASYFLGLPIGTGATVDSAGVEVPISGTLVGVIVIAGHAEEYDQSILEIMQPLLSTCAQLIIAHRNDQRRRAAEVELSEERALLAQRVAERTTELSRSNAELARAARAKDEFLATMNHELRTPLNAVMLYADSLQTQLPGPLNARQLRAVTGIRESAHHLLLLINDILDVAKMDAGKLVLDIASCDIEEICHSSLRFVSDMADGKRIDLHFYRDPAVIQMDADERRLKQMIVNLLSNAVKFTSEGGRVGLEVSGDPENNIVHLTVWDTGIGISTEDAKKLFQPFVQIDSGHSRQYGGTGLGLFLVYRMAEMHGGSVSVASEVRQGSRFTISLPWNQHRPLPQADRVLAPTHPPVIANLQGKSIVPEILPERWSSQPPYLPEQRTQATDEAQTVTAPALQAGEKLPSVLIADDNEMNLHVMTDFLQEWRCQVIVARTGTEAVQRSMQVHPDLILMDIQMPDMNGLEAIRHIRAEASLRQTPIVALTALAMPGDREQCLAAGADDYISKPIHIERLTEVLSARIQRRTLPFGS